SGGSSMRIRIPRLRRPTRSTLFPYTTLFRSHDGYVRWLLGPDVERTFKFRSMRPRGLQETPEQLLAQPKDTEEMRYRELAQFIEDRKSTRLNSSHVKISYAVFCLKKKNTHKS